MRWLQRGVAGLLSCVLSSGGALAAVPYAVNQQGLLVDTAGVPMNGDVDLTFTIWAHPTSTAPADLVYQERHFDRPVIDGVYDAQLGQGTLPTPAFSPALFAAPDRWLEIEVEAEVLTPRQRILSVPYALQAQVCESAVQASEAQSLNGFNEDDFQSVVSGSCPAGQSIRVIAQNGAVTCEVDDVGIGDITGVTAGTGLSGGAASGNATLSIASGGVTSALIADNTIANVDVAAAAAIAPTKIAGTAATLSFTGQQDFDNGLFVIDATTNRVGIDNVAPQEKLDVDGNVQASSFRYASPKTSYVSIPGIALRPAVGETVFTPVYLPDGANLTEFRCRVVDNHNSTFIEVSFGTQGWDAPGIVLAAGDTEGLASSETPVELSFPLSHTVQNQNGAFYGRAYIEDYPPGFDPDPYVLQCRVTFTRSESD